VAVLREAGIENFNLDLMYALPEQSLDEALFDVWSACSLGPTHISHYQLTLEAGTVFHSRPPPLPDDDAAWRMQTECQGLLTAAGYAQYEVSAFARDGFQCRHNLNYWLFGDYLGIGAGAHGKLSMQLPSRILRTAKPKQPREFHERIAGASAAIGDRNYIAEADLPFEFMLNALRLNSGFSNEYFQARTGLSVNAYRVAMLDVKSRGLVHATDTGWRPTELGRRFLNDLQAAFLP
jgi:putative oxygen-independent coproporphyrinogen III oxidase